ncbi:stage V sporulation protein AC [Clostridium sp. CAG:1219]|nr:stage V sporulation protein AC [Clostridium sp. CAG:1219]
MNENINMTDDQYKNYVEEKAKKSPIFKDVLLAFISGGVICIIGQIIMNIFLYYNVEKESATAFTSIILIFIGAFLTSINVYSTIGKYCGAGSAIPITGFSNSIVSPAIEFKTEGRILGLGANMFKIAGPVLVYGISTSVIVGFIYWIIKLF